MTRHKNSIPRFNVKHDYLKNSFFPLTIIEWNNLDSNIRTSENLAPFKKRILAFIRPSANSTVHCQNAKSLKLINPFVPKAPFLYPLKTSENRKVLWCFKGAEKGCLGNEWVKRMRLGLSHLRFRKFKHRFQDKLSPIRNCGTAETTIHYLLYCPNFSNEKLTVFNKL